MNLTRSLLTFSMAWACSRSPGAARVEAEAAAPGPMRAVPSESLVAGRSSDGMAGSAPVAAPLVLRSALPIAADENFQPSGLLAHDGALLTVSDKHDHTIYALERDGDGVRARPFVVFEPPGDEPPPLDFEGLAAAGADAWVLVSEARARVLRVDAEPSSAPPGSAHEPRRGRARWITPALGELGHASGCLTVSNAGFEGIAPLPGGGLLLAMEREPRGLIALGPGGALDDAKVWPMPVSLYPIDPARGTDFTDLTRVSDEVYVLARNAHLIVKLDRVGSSAAGAALASSVLAQDALAGGTLASQGWREGRAFSYREVENDPRYSYENRKYGLAEGVAVTADELLIVLDNNGQARAARPGDRRPLLFAFERPEPL